MNTTTKALMTLVAVVVVAGAGLYMTSSSRQGSPAEIQPGQPVTVDGSIAPSTSLAELDSVTAALQSDLASQSSGIAALDQSADKVASTVDSSNSTKQPYNEASI